jgi:hypothetical protein
MTLILRDELDAAATAASPNSDLVAKSRQAGQHQLVMRRRRALVGAGAAVAAVAVASNALPHWWAQNQQTAAAGGTSASASATPGPSKTAVPVAAVTGTAADWLAALERSMPYVNRTKPVRVATNGPAELSKSSSVQAVFDYTSEGRTTMLTVTVFANGTQTSPGKSALDTMLAACDQPGVSCDPVQQTVTGPVLVRHALDRGFVDALSFRASGVVVVARTPGGDTTTRSPQTSAVPQGLAPGSTATASPRPSAVPQGPAINLDELVNIAALSPEPKLEYVSGGLGPTASSTP